MLCSELYSALLSGQHSNTNMLTMGSRVVDLVEMIVDNWLVFKGSNIRHVDQIKNIEQMEGYKPSYKKVNDFIIEA